MTIVRRQQAAVLQMIQLLESVPAEQGSFFASQIERTLKEARELTRCAVVGCGLTGACDGKGVVDLYPCPLKDLVKLEADPIAARTPKKPDRRSTRPDRRTPRQRRRADKLKSALRKAK